MLFSVIVPVYNVEKYLRQCVDSILMQTFADFELILVDDGSKDSSGAICDEYAKKDARVKVIHQENAGLSVARNEGTDIALGDYVIYIDSDDYISSEEFLSKIAQKTLKNVEVILYGYKKYFESNNTFALDCCNYPNVENISTNDVVKSLLSVDMYEASAWTKAIKRSFLVQNEIKFVPKMISEDSDWYLQVITKAQTFSNVNEAFVVYRQREGSISHAPKIKSLVDNLHILENWPKRFDELALSLEMKQALMSVLARYYGNLLILYSCFNKKDVKCYYTRVKSLKYLLRYSQTKRAKIIRKFVTFFGVGFTIVMLRIAKHCKRTM